MGMQIALMQGHATGALFVKCAKLFDIMMALDVHGE